MTDPWAPTVVSWLLTYLLHSSVLLLSVWCITACLGRRRVALQESLWRGAALAAILTASLQVFGGWQPFGSRLHLAPVRAEPSAVAVASPIGIDRVDRGAGSATVGPAIGPYADHASLGIAWPAIAEAVAAAWLLLAAVGLGSVALCWLRLRRRLAGRRPMRSGPLVRTLRSLERRAGRRRPVAVSCSEQVCAPVAIGLWRGEICIPARGIDGLEPRQRESLLAHELAHVLARDPMWLVVLRCVERALWVQPLNVLARRRLQSLAEFRCDDWALRQVGDELALASCLVEVAGWLRGAAGPGLPHLAPSMAAEPSRLALRLSRILDVRRASPERRTRPGWVPAVMCFVSLAVPSVSVAEPVSAAAAGDPSPLATATPATPAADRGSERLLDLAEQLADLALVQRELVAELAALRGDVWNRAGADQWAGVLQLLEARVLELQDECARLQNEFRVSFERTRSVR